MECVSALHHNKRKTNYHIHLIFSERKLLPEQMCIRDSARPALIKVYSSLAISGNTLRDLFNIPFM